MISLKINTNMSDAPMRWLNHRSSIKTALHVIQLTSALLLLSVLLLESTEAAELTVLTPKSGAIILSRQSETYVVVKSDAPLIDKPTLQSGDDLYTPLDAWSINGQTYYHFLVSLKPGKNAFLLKPGETPIRFKHRPFRSMLTLKPNSPGVFLFHQQTELQKECALCHDKSPQSAPIKTPFSSCDSYTTDCFSCHKSLTNQSAYTHAPSSGRLCLACHADPEKVDTISFPKGRMDRLCLSCHTGSIKWLSKPHLHGPVGTGDCTVCHNPHGDQFPFQLWAEPTLGLCVACHTDKRKLGLERSTGYFAHGILKGNGCVICHDPHASENRFQLRKPINELCASCHINVDSINKEHPVRGHPVQGPRDPRRTDREFSCTSCHNPHGSMFSFLLIGDVLGGHVCGKCHQDVEKKLEEQKRSNDSL